MTRAPWNSDQGRALLARVEELAAGVNYDRARTAFAASEKIRGFDPAEIHAAVDLVLTRHSSKKLAALGAGWHGSRRSVAQASRAEVARRHASRFRGCAHVVEVGTGIGSDLRELSRVAGRVTSIEADPQVAEVAEGNMRAEGITNVRILVGQAEAVLASLSDSFDGLWSDPGRRDASDRRLRRGGDYSPPLEFVLGIEVPGPRGIKAGPSLPWAEIPADCTREYIGFGGECIELTLWRGVTEPKVGVYIADAETYWIPEGTHSVSSIDHDATTGLFLIEPHVAIIASGSAEEFFAERNCRVLASGLAYGISDNAIVGSPLCRSFKVLESFPYSLRTLTERVRARRWNSRTEIKKRGIAEEPEEIRKKLKLPQPRESDVFGTIVLARLDRSPVAFLCERVGDEPVPQRLDGEEDIHGDD